MVPRTGGKQGLHRRVKLAAVLVLLEQVATDALHGFPNLGAVAVPVEGLDVLLEGGVTARVPGAPGTFHVRHRATAHPNALDPGFLNKASVFVRLTCLFEYITDAANLLEERTRPPLLWAEDHLIGVRTGGTP